MLSKKVQVASTIVDDLQTCTAKRASYEELTKRTTKKDEELVPGTTTTVITKMEPHDEECAVEDWKATCLIYSDTETSWKLEEQQQPELPAAAQHTTSLHLKTMNLHHLANEISHDMIPTLNTSNSTMNLPSSNTSNTTCTTSTTITRSPSTTRMIIGYGSIDLAIVVKEITFTRYERSYGDDIYSNAHYRFWTCREQPVIRLEFEYCLGKNEEEEGGEIESNDNGNAFPQHVTISLLSNYPPSWPRRGLKKGNNMNSSSWIEWMNQQANDMLETHNLSSFEVCSFLERRAIIDYFDLVYEDFDSGNCLILFPDSVQEGEGDYDYYHYETDSFIVSLQSQHAFMRHWPTSRRSSGGGFRSSNQTVPISEYCTKHTLPDDAKVRILPFVLDWRQWIPNTKPCPICLECVAFSDLVTIPTCGHKFCLDCLSTYLSVQVKQVHEHRDNPFRCPTCRYGMKVIGFVKTFLDPDEMDKVRTWYRHLKHPPCYSLTQCLSSKCHTVGSLRKQAIDSYLIFCEVCDGKWCELCLKRLHDDHNHHPLDNSSARTVSTNVAAASSIDNSKSESTSQNAKGDDEDCCKAALTANFCQRYLAASDHAKLACEAKWPWIKIYANSRVHDAAVVDWLVQQGHGQVCPVCKTGVERIEGCFHISCTCGAHFCYECGEELHYPFYGTHHCWEEREQT